MKIIVLADDTVDVEEPREERPDVITTIDFNMQMIRVEATSTFDFNWWYSCMKEAWAGGKFFVFFFPLVITNDATPITRARGCELKRGQQLQIDVAALHLIQNVSWEGEIWFRSLDW